MTLKRPAMMITDIEINESIADVYITKFSSQLNKLNITKMYTCSPRLEMSDRPHLATCALFHIRRLTHMDYRFKATEDRETISPPTIGFFHPDVVVYEDPFILARVIARAMQEIEKIAQAFEMDVRKDPQVPAIVNDVFYNIMKDIEKGDSEVLSQYKKDKRNNQPVKLQEKYFDWLRIGYQAS